MKSRKLKEEENMKITEPKTTTHVWRGSALFSTLMLASVGCIDGTQTGSLRVLLESEDVIVDGLQAGDDVENIQDGWSASFEKYIVAIGDIDMHLSVDESVDVEAADIFVVDLTEVPSGGLALWEVADMPEGRWEFNYSTLGAADGSTRHESVSEEDYNAMVANDWTYWIDGVLTNGNGQSCPPKALATPGDKAPNGNKSGDNDCYDASAIRFTFGASAETTFGPCEIDEVTGFAITANGTQTVAATIHGDHIFFNGFPEGSEGGTTRLAQWLADCDLNLDGTVTKDELEAISPSQLPEIDERFQLGGSPITPLNDMYDYVTAQLKTQGHFQGEGECPVDGVAHEHDDHTDDDH